MWFRKNKSTTRNTRSKGREIELLAERYLKKKGLKIITKNFQVRGGEIDLIMSDGPVLVFVEVRYRHSTHYGSGADSITSIKKRRLVHTAEHYLQTNYRLKVPPRIEPSCRFDVISVTDNPIEIQWIKNAF